MLAGLSLTSYSLERRNSMFKRLKKTFKESFKSMPYIGFILVIAGIGSASGVSILYMTDFTAQAIGDWVWFIGLPISLFLFYLTLIAGISWSDWYLEKHPDTF
jgi:uncharacterized membrane protein YesL